MGGMNWPFSGGGVGVGELTIQAAKLSAPQLQSGSRLIALHKPSLCFCKLSTASPGDSQSWKRKAGLPCCLLFEIIKSESGPFVYFPGQ